jgi:hypothetical protein
MSMEPDVVNGPAAEPLGPGWFRGPDGYYPPARHPDPNHRAMYATQAAPSITTAPPDPPPSPPAQTVVASPPATATAPPPQQPPAPPQQPPAPPQQPPAPPQQAAPPPQQPPAPPQQAPPPAQQPPAVWAVSPPPADHIDNTGYNTLFEVRWKGGWPGIFSGESQEKALVRALADLNGQGLRVAAAVNYRWSFFKRLGMALLAIVTLGFVVHHPNTILVVERISTPRRGGREA